MSEKNNNKRKIKRILALVFSGVYVMIVLPVIAIFVSLNLDSLFNFLEIVPYPINIVFTVIFLVNGFFWAIWSNIGLYITGKGSPVPLKGTQTTELVVKGPYKYTRNPMIFGYLSFWAGLGFLFFF